MLYVDNKKYEVTNKQINLHDFINNGIEGYCINIHVEFSHDNKEGYLDIDAGFEKEKNIMSFIGKEYHGAPFPFDNKDQFLYLEIFDTEKFLDSDILDSDIEGKIDLKIIKIIDRKVFVNFELDDVSIKIKFEGELDYID